MKKYSGAILTAVMTIFLFTSILTPLAAGAVDKFDTSEGLSTINETKIIVGYKWYTNTLRHKVEYSDGTYDMEDCAPDHCICGRPDSETDQETEYPTTDTPPSDSTDTDPPESEKEHHSTAYDSYESEQEQNPSDGIETSPNLLDSLAEMFGVSTDQFLTVSIVISISILLLICVISLIAHKFS